MDHSSGTNSWKKKRKRREDEMLTNSAAVELVLNNVPSRLDSVGVIRRELKLYVVNQFLMESFANMGAEHVA